MKVFDICEFTEPFGEYLTIILFLVLSKETEGVSSDPLVDISKFEDVNLGEGYGELPDKPGSQNIVHQNMIKRLVCLFIYLNIYTNKYIHIDDYLVPGVIHIATKEDLLSLQFLLFVYVCSNRPFQ